jgi:hypothetical protein
MSSDTAVLGVVGRTVGAWWIVLVAAAAVVGLVKAVVVLFQTR